MPPRQTFLCSKGKGNSRGLPCPLAPGPSRCPHPQLSLSAAPSSARPGGGGGGQRLLAVSNVHFLNQTNPPPARSLRAGAGAALSRAGIVGSWAPQKGPERASNWGGGRWDIPSTGPRPHPAVARLTNTRGHTPTIARARTTPPPPPGQEKESFQVVRAPPDRLCPTSPPHTDFSERLFRPRGPWLGPGRPGRGRGAPGERAAYLPGLTLGLTARGWKAPRGLTSDPLSSPRSFLALPHPPGGRKQTLCGARRATPTPRGAGRRRPGASSRPPRPEGAGPGGHLLPAPTPTLRNATWPPKRSGGNRGSGESAWGQEVARSSTRRAFPERLLCAPRGEWGPLPRGEIVQRLTFVRPLPPPDLPPAV